MPDLTFLTTARKDSAGAARNLPSKFNKSWFTNLFARASSASHPPIPSRHLPQGQAHAQMQSQLFSALPLEIRRQIYEHVLCSYGTVQHIFLSNGKLTHMRCATPSSHSLFQSISAKNDVCNTYDPVYCKSVQNGWEIVPLLLSCRQIYLEIIGMLYSSTIFRLPISGAGTRLIATVPAPYLALAHIHISFPLFSPMYLPLNVWPTGFTPANSNRKADEAEWEAFWRAFARVRLRVLYVEILDWGVRVPEQMLLAPLRQVSAGEFEVVLPWPVGLDTSGEFGDAGFRVRRPPEGTNLMLQMNVAKYGRGVGKGRGVWERLRWR
ncbi:hypothetical protein LOCC1_G008827 [Lachnellula occidentalis]|uniref:DUF7730 domain-containing protein n=1 Tax=Lachnellula occidentalis TaxID=215460 RepID=A0A8H8RBZ6_9HELO|nr:hypothetical protein LOCC1_G008827 [Lachnellula occidentalis]